MYVARISIVTLVNDTCEQPTSDCIQNAFVRADAGAFYPPMQIVKFSAPNPT